jgi:hypothetical protein
LVPNLRSISKSVCHEFEHRLKELGKAISNGPEFVANAFETSKLWSIFENQKVTTNKKNELYMCGYDGIKLRSRILQDHQMHI